MRTVVLLGIALCATLFHEMVDGATYYVAQNDVSASDDNSGTEQAPWKTIIKAANEAVAGDLVWIKAGTYHEPLQIKNSGTYYASEIHFITFAAFADDEVVIDGTREIGQQEWQAMAGSEKAFFCSLADEPGQVFVDGKRLAEAKHVVPDGKGSNRVVPFEVTDATANCWLWDKESKHLFINTNDGNPSLKHKVEVTLYGVYLDPNTFQAPGLRYEGRGTHGDYVRLHGLRFDRIKEILSYSGFHFLEDCVIRAASGPYAVNVPGIVRRNTIIDSLNQALYWPSNSVLEDNSITGTLQNLTTLTEDYAGVLKANGGSYSTVRNNIVLDSARPPAFSQGPPAIWADTSACYNAVYGNVCLGHFTGLYIEAAANYNVVAYNTAMQNHLGIGVRENQANLFFGNYLAQNDFGVSVWDARRWPGMLANTFTGNFFTENTGAHFWMQDAPEKSGPPMVMLSDNHYTAQPGRSLIRWAARSFTDLPALHAATGQQAGSISEASSDRQLELVRFRLPFSSQRGVLLPMVGNARLFRTAPSATLGGRPYFWREGDASSWSFGNGVNGPLSSTAGVIQTSYPNLPRLWADGGTELMGLEGLRLSSNKDEDKQRLGLKIKGIKPEDMDPVGDGWLTPSLPTMAGTSYSVSFKVRGKDLKPLTEKNGPVAFAIWTNDTGQKTVRSYLLGLDDSGKRHSSVPSHGTFSWQQVSDKVTAPADATRVRFLFGLRRSSGLVVYDDIWLTAE